MIHNTCPHHKRIELGYIQWHEMARKRISQKYTQVKCCVCKLYMWPDELNEPENEKANRIIAKHQRYLEDHPKSIPIKLEWT